MQLKRVSELCRTVRTCGTDSMMAAKVGALLGLNGSAGGNGGSGDAGGCGSDQPKYRRKGLEFVKQEMRRDMNDDVAMVDDLAKREKAVEFAIRMTAPQQHDPVELARAIHAFLTEPAAEITVTVT